MKLCVLGPLELRSGRAPMPLGAPKQQVVMAMLAVHAGQPLTIGQFVDELWPERPPASAVPNVRAYVGNLRRILDAIASSTLRVVRQPAGYALIGNEQAMDLRVFRSEVSAGEQALRRGYDAEAAHRFAGALDMWRGPMLSGLPVGPVLTGACAAVQEERLTLVERLAELHLTAGEPGRAVGLLREHTHTHPTRERAQAALMRALYQTGDIAAALDAYAAARRALVEQLGIEPGSDLRDMHAAVLNRDPALDPPGRSVAVAGAAVAAVIRPRELPADVGRLVGRERETRGALDALGAPAAPHRSRARVVAFHGSGGVGKSALAVHVAHRAGDAFPDGHIYVDLLGSTPGLRPLEPVDVLRRLLRSLGLRDPDLPQGIAGLVATVRTRTAGGRYLLLLDNARDVEQIGELIPASPGSAVLITSRHPLRTLDVDHRMYLGGLKPRDGVALLRHLVPGAGLDDDAAHRIGELCEHLPLALRIVAGRLTDPRGSSPQELLERLTDRRRRLDELELDGIAIRSSIGVGLDTLAAEQSAEAARALRAIRGLAQLHVPTFGVGVVAAMLDLTNDVPARAALDRLSNVGLAEPLPHDRYRLHDLVRLVAAEWEADGADQDPPEMAMRALSYYAGRAAVVHRTLRGQRLLPIGSQQMSDTPPERLELESSSARRWVDTELPNLTGLVEVLCQTGRADLFPQLLEIAGYTWDFLEVRKEWAAAHRVGKRLTEWGHCAENAEVRACGYLFTGRTAADQGEVDEAIRDLNRSLDTYRGLKLPFGEITALIALGIVLHFRGNHIAGIGYMSDALAASRRYGTAIGEGVALLNRATFHGAMGAWEEAFKDLQRSLAIRTTLGIATTLSTRLNLAVVHCVWGHYQDACTWADETIEISRNADDRVVEHQALMIRSEIYLRSRRFADAERDTETALSLAIERGDLRTRAVALFQRSKIKAAVDGVPLSMEARAAADRLLGETGEHRHPFQEAWLFGASAVPPPGLRADQAVRDLSRRESHSAKGAL